MFRISWLYRGYSLDDVETVDEKDELLFGSC